MSTSVCELPTCDKAFTPVRGWQKYCSKPCRLTELSAKPLPVRVG